MVEILSDIKVKLLWQRMFGSALFVLVIGCFFLIGLQNRNMSLLVRHVSYLEAELRLLEEEVYKIPLRAENSPVENTIGENCSSAP